MKSIKDIASNKRVQNVALILLVAAIVYYNFKGEIDAWVKRTLGIEVEDIEDAEKIDFDLKLKKGVSSVEVTVLQNAILEDGGKLPRFGTDGIFGNETETALFDVKGVKSITLNQYKEESDYDFTDNLNLYDGSGIAGGIDFEEVEDVLTA